MIPRLESYEDREEFFIMSVVVELMRRKGSGVESERVDFGVQKSNGENGCNGVVRGVSFYSDLRVQNPVSKNRSCSKCFLECIERGAALIGEIPWNILPGESSKRNNNTSIVVN